MATLTIYTKDQWLQMLAEQFASSAGIQANLAEGSAIGAAFEAIALMAVQLQGSLVTLQNYQRLGTSADADRDSFVSPFGITRLGAVASTGSVTFSIPSVAGQALVIPVGAIVQTPNGLAFAVVVDNSNPAYNALAGGYPTGGYILAAGLLSVVVTVQCNTAGAIGNVQANQITQMVSSGSAPIPPGISSVTNTQAFTTGADAETGDQLAARFTVQESSGRVGTLNAIAAAILSVQPGLTYALGDQVNADGTAHPAYVTAIVNVLGQSIGPSGSLITAIIAAINAIRAGGMSFQVLGPTLVPVNVTATIHYSTGTDFNALQIALTNAYDAFVNGIGLNPAGGSTTCAFIDVGMALRQVKGVTRVDLLTLNAAALDITAAFASQLVAGTATFTLVTP
jgi:uncharacterized phage protein gp47/JayE